VKELDTNTDEDHGQPYISCQHTANNNFKKILAIPFDAVQLLVWKYYNIANKILAAPTITGKSIHSQYLKHTKVKTH